MLWSPWRNFGTGIEGEDNDRIFEPFFTTKSAGTGIGLTICRMIIEAHGEAFGHLQRALRDDLSRDIAERRRVNEAAET